MSGVLASALRRRVRRVLDLPRTLRHRALHESGTCSVCGRASRFLARGTNLKESLHCVRCGAWTRVRLLAEVLVTEHAAAGSASNAEHARAGAVSLAELVREPHFRTLAIHEAQASGPLNAVLRACPGHVGSEWLSGVAPGATRRGVRCEDLQALSFADASLDLAVHQSVLEHLPRPRAALAESFRVLRPGGRLVFEVPMTDPGASGLRARSVARVDPSSGARLLPPVFHDDPLRPEGALVHTDFGQDVLEWLADAGFEARLVARHLPRSTMSHAVVVVARKPGNPA